MNEVKVKLAKVEKDIENQVKTTVSENIAEKNEIEQKKFNLVVFGVPEPTPDNIDEEWDTETKINYDIDTVCDVIEYELGVGLSPRNGIYDARRLGLKNPGKPRPLRICFDTIETKRDVLKNAKYLRDSTSSLAREMYFNPDLTKKQRDVQLELKKEMWKRRSEGENVIISRGEIINVNWNVRKDRATKPNHK